MMKVNLICLIVIVWALAMGALSGLLHGRFK